MRATTYFDRCSAAPIVVMVSILAVDAVEEAAVAVEEAAVAVEEAAAEVAAAVLAVG